MVHAAGTLSKGGACERRPYDPCDSVRTTCRCRRHGWRRARGGLRASAPAGPRAAFGAVSATGGKWRCWKGGEIDRWLQSDLDIYPGFGGGPLVDATGRIHGVNSGGLSRALATTIPVATVNRVMTQLLERGYVARGWIGAAMQPVRLDPATQQRLKREGGLLLLSVEPDAPASRAGLLVGDVVVAIDD